MKKKIKYIFYSVFFLMILLLILNTSFLNLDELWSYSFARNIFNGLIPYKDFNAVSTPLSFFINSIIINISDKLISFRILYFIYCLLFACIVSKIFNYLKVCYIYKYLFLFITSLVLIKVNYLDYNFLQLIFICLIIYLELKNKDNDKINIISLLVGLTVINKQSTGLFIFIAFALLRFIDKYYFKKNINLFKCLVIFSIPIVLFIIYLLITSSFMNFIDMAVFGIKTFSNKSINFGLLISLLTFCIGMIILVILSKNKKNAVIFLLYSLASVMVMYPLLDYVHFIIGIIPILLYLIYEVNLVYKFDSILFSYIIIFCMFLILGSSLSGYINSYKSEIDFYKYLPSTKNVDKFINNVDKYILENSTNHNVYILDYTSSMFNLPIKKYTKYFDLFMNGNFGVNGEDEVYSILDNKDNIVLVSNVNNNRQTPKKILDYVYENYHFVQSIENFLVYVKK